MVQHLLAKLIYVLGTVFNTVVGTAMALVSLAYLGLMWCVGGKENRAFMRQKWTEKMYQHDSDTLDHTDSCQCDRCELRVKDVITHN